MASDRIAKELAETYPIPPFTWHWRKASQILTKKIPARHIEDIALNEPLMKNIVKENIKNPFLLSDEWWPIVGGQRIRAIHEIRKVDLTFDPIIRVAVFDKPWGNEWFLWPDKEFRKQALAIQFQMWELVFKSEWYTAEKTEEGTDMRFYEELGDTLKGWKHRQL